LKLLKIVAVALMGMSFLGASASALPKLGKGKSTKSARAKKTKKPKASAKFKKAKPKKTKAAAKKRQSGKLVMGRKNLPDVSPSSDKPKVKMLPSKYDGHKRMPVKVKGDNGQRPAGEQSEY